LISIPVSLFSLKAILDEEVDEAIAVHADQFKEHIKRFEYLGDLETDLTVLDQLSFNIHIKPAEQFYTGNELKNISVYDSVSREEKPFRELMTYVMIKGKPYKLTVQSSLVENDDLVLAIGLVQAALSIFLAAGLLLMNRSLSKRLWKPFYKTLDQLKAYELDKSESIPLETSGIIEFNDLNKAVSHLTERNRKVFLNQKEFIENASHELQTPIAIFQSKLDTLMQSPNLTQTEAETLTDLESTAQRMARLNKNLLLLSKIDNEQFIDKEEIELPSMIQSQVNSLQPMAQLENLTITTSLDLISIKANRTLIEVLLSNLLHNAIRYSPKGGEISINLHQRSLSITNGGQPLGMGIEKMTERFVKESNHPNSTGLGLAIIQKICDSCGYTLNYRYEDAKHEFSIAF
jgi:signal transduction histidine kinase